MSELEKQNSTLNDIQISYYPGGFPISAAINGGNYELSEDSNGPLSQESQIMIATYSFTNNGITEKESDAAIVLIPAGESTEIQSFDESERYIEDRFLSGIADVLITQENGKSQVIRINTWENPDARICYGPKTKIKIFAITAVMIEEVAIPGFEFESEDCPKGVNTVTVIKPDSEEFSLLSLEFQAMFYKLVFEEADRKNERLNYLFKR